ncbi:MAG: LysR family transcriptional regulator [Desulfobacterales bacterium]|nr:LysR family transcriptional regulator [Desulfobacterales bacterium]
MEISLQNFDLNLLVIFDALMIERSVTRAADRVCLSQPATSHALKRLRELLDDPIMVKTEKGMTPTHKALSMEVPIREALTNLQHSLYTPEPFDPSVNHASFVIYTPEYFEILYLPVLSSRLQKLAPNIQVMDIIIKKTPEEGLLSGEVDYAICVEGMHEVPKSLHCKPWIHDTLACVVRKDNTLFGDQISLDEFKDARHIAHSTLGIPSEPTFLDSWLKTKKINRHITVTTPGYLSAAKTAEVTDYVLTLPLRSAQSLAKKMDLRIVDPPESFPDYRLNLIWHSLYDKDPAHMWFRGQLLDLANQEIV